MKKNTNLTKESKEELQTNNSIEEKRLQFEKDKSQDSLEMSYEEVLKEYRSEMKAIPKMIKDAIFSK